MKTLLSSLFCLFFAFHSQAQKIKYKDVFPLLSPQQTEEGIRLLRLFLQEEKNQDEANAIYQMGSYYYDRYQMVDVLTDTATMLAYSDSAISFLERGLPLLTEKELKKNDTYYQSFYRRDLRTGEFGIKLSDVQLELENKVKAIRERNDKVTVMHQLLASMQLTHQSMINAFNSIIEAHPSYESYLFQLNAAQRQEITALTEFQYQLDDKAQEVEALNQEIAAKLPFSSIKLESVAPFTNLEVIFDPYNNAYTSWDVESWVDKVTQLYKEEVTTYKSGLLRWDRSLNLAKERMSEGVPSTIRLEPTDEMADLQGTYDEKAAMLRYLETKAQVFLIASLTDTLLTPQWLDSTQVQLNVDLSDSLMNLINSAAMSFDGLKEGIVNDAPLYEEHIDELYGGVSAISSAISKWQKQLSQQREEWQAHQSFWALKNTLLIWEDQWISIDTTSVNDTVNYTIVDRSDLDDYVRALVLKREDSTLQLLKAGADRAVSWMTAIDMKLMDSTQYEWMPATSEVTTLMSIEKQDTTSYATMLKLSEAGELVWKTDPVQIKAYHHVTWDSVIDQYTLFFYPEEAYPLTDGSAGYVIVDANGQVK